MQAGTEVTDRSPLMPIVFALLTLGVVRTAGRLVGLVALLVIVISCVGALAIGIVVLRLALLH
jgi:hypothetical protein